MMMVLTACAGSPRGVPADPPQPVSVAHAPAVVAPQSAPDLDDAAVVARTHELFAALDRADLASVRAMTTPTFTLYEEARFLETAYLTRQVQQRIDKQTPARSRTWSDEHAIGVGGTRVFIGRAVEVWPAIGGQPAFEQDGYNTIVWVRDGARWQAAFWQWDRAGTDAERQRWNAWLKAGVGFNHKPNELLVDTVKGRKPGIALDLGTGQGRNAVFLATQGWKTTGVDIADEGLRITQEGAATMKVKLETIEADLDKWDLGKDKWDLVTLIYAHESPDMVERIKPSLKKSGLFVCEYFHADSEVAKTGAGGWRTGELAALFKSGFKILLDDVVEDNADWAGQRKTKLVRFVAQKL